MGLFLFEGREGNGCAELGEPGKNYNSHEASRAPLLDLKQDEAPRRRGWGLCAPGTLLVSAEAGYLRDDWDTRWRRTCECGVGEKGRTAEKRHYKKKANCAPVPPPTVTAAAEGTGARSRARASCRGHSDGRGRRGRRGGGA